MKTDILKTLEHLPYFTINGFKQLIGDGEQQSKVTRNLIWRWLKAERILSLKRGVYMTRRFYEMHRNEAGFSAAISAILLPQSYLSLEYVLQQAGMLSEATYPITAVTPRNTRTVENQLGVFVYRHIKLALYQGFQQYGYHGVLYHQASSAKALFDWLYLRPLPDLRRKPVFDLAEELRLNLDEASPELRQEFRQYVDNSSSPKMRAILENLEETVWQP